MSLLTYPIGRNAPVEVHAIVEIPKGSSNKYEFDLHHEVFVLDRVLYSPLYYPFDYGWIAGTLSEDGDPLDILVMTTHPTFPGCVLPARPIGALRMTDEHGPDLKILAACDCDPRFNAVRALQDVPGHARRELVFFFEAYKQLEEKNVEVFGWEERGVAHAEILRAVERAKSRPTPDC